MSESSFATFRKINRTPWRDLLRLRLTGRLDWKGRLASASLPMPVSQMIARVVKKTRLWRLEKVAVTDELIAHFQDGLTAGSTAEELIEKFGGERAAAKLIRRAKRRGRPLLWHGWIFVLRATAILIGVYFILLIRFCVGRPTVSVNYLAKLNEPILQTQMSDRAWPIWRRAILASSDGVKDEHLIFSDTIYPLNAKEKVTWHQQVDWLAQHSSAAEFARQAAAKPSLGFVLGPGASADDPELGYHHAGNPAVDFGLIQVLLPHLSHLRRMGVILDMDARLAVEQRNASRLEADLKSMLGLNRQLHDADGILVTQLVGLGMYNLAIHRLEFTLVHSPDLLDDAQLIRLAHTFAPAKVAADLINIKGERVFFDDIVQRTYTDDGQGDGHITMHGFQLLVQMGTSADSYPRSDYLFASAFPVLSASRSDLMAHYNSMMNQTEADFRLPMRQVDPNRASSQIIALRHSSISATRYWPLVLLMPSLTRAQEVCESDLGDRDVAEVGIALELFHRKFGKYPSNLVELTPQFLPEIPADRITGDPVKYRLIDNNPVVYSVGVDRTDDGGKPPAKPGYTAAQWGGAVNAETRGDWILYPGEIAGEE